MDFLALLKAERAAARGCAGEEQQCLAAVAVAKLAVAPAKLPASLVLSPLHLLPNLHLTDLVVGGGVQYAQEVISRETEAALFSVVCSDASYTELSSRLVQAYGTQPGAGPDTLLPSWLDTLGQDLANLGVFGADSDTGGTALRVPNNVLINQYVPPRGGILHHTDGPAYCPTVAILSLGGPCVLSFKRRLLPSEIGSPDADHGEACSVLLQPRSLLRFTGEYYIGHTHGIAPDVSQDVLTDTCVNASMAGAAAGQRVERGRRVSLTFRIVPPASKVIIVA